MDPPNVPNEPCASPSSHRHGKGKALSILAHKIGRAVFYMLSRRRCSRWTNSARRSEEGSGRAKRLTRASRTELVEIARDADAPSVTTVDHEPEVRQRARLMGRPLSSPPRVPGTAAPPPSLAITDALRRRRSS